MLSKKQMKIRMKRKTNPELEETISKSMKNKNWMNIAKILSGPTRKQAALNLLDIEKNSKVGDTIVVPGKILSQGDLTKKIRICALSISAQAREKLKDTRSEFVTFIEEIKKNPKAEGIKVLR